MIRPTIRRGAQALLLILTAPAAPLTAQEAPSDTVRPIHIDPVTVTVVRTPLELERVPLAVTVVERTRPDHAQPQLALDAALHGIPGVQVDNRYNFALGERISIRGFGARSQFGVRGVKVLVDGIPATLPDGQTALGHVDPGTIERVEVIRGPASSLWGNTAGGVIQLETAEPPAEPLAQEVGVLVGSHGLLRLRSTTGGRSGRAAYQLSASRLDFGGHREFSDATNNYASGRLAYAFRDSDLRLTFNAVDYDARNPGSLSDSLLRVDRSQAFAGNVRQRTGEAGRQAQVGLLWRWRGSAGEVDASGYGLGRSLENPIPNTIIDLDRRAGGLRLLYRSPSLATVAHPRLTIGGEVDVQRDDRRNHDNEQGERGSLTLDQLERVTNTALFAQALAEPLRGLALLGGVRYDRFRFSADDRLVGPTDPDDSGARTMDALSPSLGVSYTAAGPLTLFANVGTAFETPTTTELTNRPEGAGGFNPELEPQTAVSLEAGFRGQTPIGRYELSVYTAGLENALIPFEVPDAPGRQFFRNAGAAVHRGVEAAATIALTPYTGVQAAYSFTDARFREYVVSGVDYAGNRLPGIAPHRLEATVVRSSPAGWYAAADALAASSTPVDDAGEHRSPGYWTLDLRAGAARTLGRVEVEPYAGVSNVLNRRYDTSVVINAFGGRYYEPAPGRSFYAGARVRIP